MNASDPTLSAPLHRDFDVGIEELLPEFQKLLFRLYIASQILRLRDETCFCAVVLLHRYVLTRGRGSSHPTSPSIWDAAACLFLATKSEEEPRRLRDMINLSRMILSEESSLNNTEAKSSDLKILIEVTEIPPRLNKEYWKDKKALVETEQKVLRWLGFDVFVPHPHRVVRLLLGHLSPAMQTRITNLACSRLNDALFFPRCLQNPVLELACSSINMSLHEIDDTNIPASLVGTWWRRYQVSDSIIEDISKDLEVASRYRWKEGGYDN